VTNQHAFVPCRAHVALDDVVRCSGLDLFQFANLPRELAPRSARVRETSALAIDLSEGYDAYLASRKQPPHGRFIKGLEQSNRRLDRDHPDLRFDFCRHDEAAVAQLIRWKSAQYRRTGKRDPFAPARVRELIERLAAQPAPRCRGSVSVLRTDDEILAVDLSVRSERVFSGWFTAYNPEFAPRSPGSVLLLRLVAAVAADGIRLFDLSSGDQAFKLHLANTTLEAVTGWVGRARPGALLCRARRGPAEFLDHLVVAHPGLRAVARRTLRGVGALRALTDLAQGVGEAAK
jgi:CelD/BcsL family acetyltransferase involved in cellulose biosynthesis